jgi:hypothetical protein
MFTAGRKTMYAAPRALEIASEGSASFRGSATDRLPQCQSAAREAPTAHESAPHCYMLGFRDFISKGKEQLLRCLLLLTLANNALIVSKSPKTKRRECLVRALVGVHVVGGLCALILRSRCCGR